MKDHSLRKSAFIAVLALVSVTAAVFQASAPARAATGDNLASFDATVTAGIPPCGGGVGTGLAFDGTNLLLSCWGSNVLQRVVAGGAHGSAGPLTIAGMTDIRAMAFDASRAKIWACEGITQVFLIDPAASTSVSQFPVAGCQDGLAFDGTDDTIWASPDAFDTIYHYKTDGTLIGSFSGLIAKLGGFGNSGIAVGGSSLYLGNDGGSQIYQCDKGLVTCTLMSTFPARIEDLECDDVTFPGKNAVWSQDAYDRILNAWEIPAGTCGLGGEPPKPPGPANNVPTKGVISTSGSGPVIECKWELPDMDSSTAGIQYTKPPGHIHDDDMTTVPDADGNPTNGIQVPCAGPPATPATQPNGVHHEIQVAPNYGNLPEQRQIQNWLAVDAPGTVSDTFWQVFEPCNAAVNPACGAVYPGLAFKLQVHGTMLTTAECQALVGTSTTDGAMTEAAIHDGEVTKAAFDDTNKGMLALCQQGVKGLYRAEWPLSKDQPCGEYRIDATAVSVGGATTTLTNYIDVLCTFMLQVDFAGNPPSCPGGIDWGVIVPGSTSTVGGDLLWTPPCDTHPTVKNVGNDGMGLKLTFSDLVGAQFGKHIYTFDACYGRHPVASLLKCFPSIVNQPGQTSPTSPEIDTQVDFGTLPEQVLCSDELGKLDPSVHPQAGLPADTYSGTATLVGYSVSAECFGQWHKDGTQGTHSP